MNCLFDYIGVKNCGSDIVPGSGLYINELPGISLESIEKTASKDQITFKGLWVDVQNEAYEIFSTDFFNEVSKCYSINRKFDYEALLCANIGSLARAWRYLLAAQLMFIRAYSSRINFFTINKDDANDLYERYQGLYKQALSKAMKFIDVSHYHHPGLHCGGDPEIVTCLP